MSTLSQRQQVISYVKTKSMVSPSDVESQGLPRAYLYQLARDGVIEHVGRGVYQWPEMKPDIHSALAEVAKRVPNGVVSLLSALSFYELTSQNPFEVWMALETKSWKPKLDYPPTRFIFMSENSIKAGVEIHEINGVEVKVFSPEKTVADCFKYRNKVGLDVALEALKEGLRRKLFSVDELMRHAKTCRVSRVIQPYVESLA